MNLYNSALLSIDNRNSENVS